MTRRKAHFPALIRTTHLHEWQRSRQIPRYARRYRNVLLGDLGCLSVPPMLLEATSYSHGFNCHGRRHFSDRAETQWQARFTRPSTGASKFAIMHTTGTQGTDNIRFYRGPRGGLLIVACQCPWPAIFVGGMRCSSLRRLSTLMTPAASCTRKSVGERIL